MTLYRIRCALFVASLRLAAGYEVAWLLRELEADGASWWPVAQA